MIVREEYVTVDVNREMLHHYSPQRNLLYGAIFYLAVFLLAPVTLDVKYDFPSACYVLACSAAFICGCIIVPPPILPKGFVIKYSSSQLKRIVYILFLLSLIATLAKFYDSFFIRGISTSLNMFENREVSDSGSGNPIAIIAAFFMFAPYILLLLLFCFGKYFQPFEKIIIWFFFGIQSLYTLLMGSRSGFLFAGVFVALSIIYFRKVKLRFNLKTLTVTLVILIMGCTISGKMYTERFHLMIPNDIVANASRGAGAAATVPSNDTVYKLMCEEEEDSWTQSFLVGYVNICQYYLHGLLEFPGQKNYVDAAQGRHTNGACMFDIYIKFFDKIFGKEHVSLLLDAFVHPGIFCSVFGHIYTDFGWFGLIVMFFWGFIQKLIWSCVYKTGNIILLPWVFLGGMVIFLFPLLNLFAGVLCYGFTFTILMYFLFHMQMFYSNSDEGDPEKTAILHPVKRRAILRESVKGGDR